MASQVIEVNREGAEVYHGAALCAEKAVEVYERMKRERCRTNTETYTLMINVYGKVRPAPTFPIEKFSSPE